METESLSQYVRVALCVIAGLLTLNALIVGGLEPFAYCAFSLLTAALYCRLHAERYGPLLLFSADLPDPCMTFMERAQEDRAPGVRYHQDADDELVRLLEELRASTASVRIDYGDPTSSTVYQSTSGLVRTATWGEAEIPVLVQPGGRRSEPIRDHRIVCVADARTGGILYRCARRPAPARYPAGLFQTLAVH